MKTYDEIKAGTWTMAMHLHMSHAHVYRYKSDVDPRISFHKISPKNRKEKLSMSFTIDDVAQEFKTLEEAVIALGKREQQIEYDKAWEEAAPKTKEPPI